MNKWMGANLNIDIVLKKIIRPKSKNGSERPKFVAKKVKKSPKSPPSPGHSKRAPRRSILRSYNSINTAHCDNLSENRRETYLISTNKENLSVISENFEGHSTFLKENFDETSNAKSTFIYQKSYLEPIESRTLNISLDSIDMDSSACNQITAQTPRTNFSFKINAEMFTPSDSTKNGENQSFFSRLNNFDISNVEPAESSMQMLGQNDSSTPKIHVTNLTSSMISTSPARLNHDFFTMPCTPADVAFTRHYNEISPIPEFNNFEGISFNISTSTQKNFELNGGEAKNVIEANLWSDSMIDTSKLPSFSKEKLIQSCQTEYKRESIPKIQPSTTLKRKLADEKFCIDITPYKKPTKPVNKRKTISWCKTEPKHSKPARFSVNYSSLQTAKYSEDFTKCGERHVNPFVSTLKVYDDKWLESQIKQYEKWLNRLLAPPSDLDCNPESKKVDLVKLWQQVKQKDLQLAPSKEIVSNLYNTGDRLNLLRKRALILFKSEEISEVLRKSIEATTKLNVSIREDKNLHLDVGLQCEIMQLFLCYNPLWLRIGLETIYEEHIYLNSNSDIHRLSAFIMYRLFRDPELDKKYAAPGVKNLFLPGYAPAIKLFTYRKFLMLIYFLDQAKNKKLIGHDPCLFCVNSPIKDSREILLSFSRTLLSGVGDMAKLLRRTGYVLTYKQTALDEFDYAVKNVALDLQDGVRLTRIVEIILMRNDLCTKLRVPAISRLQKVHNVNVAIEALREANFNLPKDITNDIVGRHREKTLALLWELMDKVKAPFYHNKAAIIQNWWKSVFIATQRRIVKKKQMEKRKWAAVEKIQIWYREKIKNIKPTLNQERREFLQIRKSSIKIQRWFRSILLVRQVRKRFLTQKESCVKIQRFYRSYKLMKHDRNKFITYKKSALKIEQFYLASKSMKKARQEFLNTKRSIIFIQRQYRSLLAMRRERSRFLQMKAATLKIENFYKNLLHARKIRAEYLAQKDAAVTIQRFYRSWKLMKEQRARFIAYKTAANSIKSFYLSVRNARKIRQEFLLKKQTAILIQRKYRSITKMRQERKRFLNIRKACVKIQRFYRITVLNRKIAEEFMIMAKSARKIQQYMERVKVLQQ